MKNAQNISVSFLVYAFWAWLDLNVNINYNLYLFVCFVLLAVVVVNWYNLARQTLKELLNR